MGACVVMSALRFGIVSVAVHWYIRVSVWIDRQNRSLLNLFSQLFSETLNRLACAEASRVNAGTRVVLCEATKGVWPQKHSSRAGLGFGPSIPPYR
jgi:hypothetical protein